MSDASKPHSTQDDIATVRYYLNIVAEEDSLAEAHAALARLVEQLETLARERERALYLAEHLWQMIPQEIWRDHGAEWMGQYEGDHHAQKVRDELADLRASTPATKQSGWRDSSGAPAPNPTGTPRGDNLPGASFPASEPKEGA